ncbi:MAG: 4-hydroxy-3-methylbut-2-en-1-yl diphosphate synthase [Tenericutes bacterium GWC2_34_14]|nr:MAG: 4-hydroxy-3-methylbut-2-en-1-yl diphosphate synthase [Tenericutes bacterium GWA2_35_7]OHE28629.1 MAG: 4-hydroxy-3-methylbut-2-en-1-yl diphosphate synthase [Tenericutes bacterium GWC2_34_14]OHE33463.1 MAG: 4-hydroxy-3-methylbut-2-en-1-yl diphosphate synthase [Tenericutes bacterium GWE2_34_108]OHE36748.1 MAG: 4-hydroxy-3-methylbut-2-en-1-yl diphosphate synthase [Tenericutes bacterium GWF1_35_14]OHE38172.1 MAG: 4-hydroxy-3-methylbut-2-en-1-yl diphosphate synthase [Tenericutes bacterium GWF
MTQRESSRPVTVGPYQLGGNTKVYIQSMTNTYTKDVEQTVKQIKQLTDAGCDIVRVAVLDMVDAKALGEIKKQISIPLVADIHFDYRLALEAINQGVDKIRLNPGNIPKREHVMEVVEACKAKNIPIRIGVNSGSLPNRMAPTPENMVATAKHHVEILESMGFYDIVLSLKATDMNLMIEAYRLAAKTFPYPLHLGVTEAGTAFSGAIKSAMGIGILLAEGIGNTIRVSLTDNPILEIQAAKEILKNLGLKDKVPNLISCPTCGRIQYDMIDIAKRIEQYLLKINKTINVAIMGCAVNGPGEATHADIGIAGGKGEAILFRRGKIIKKIKESEVYDVLVEEINNFDDSKKDVE